MNKSRFAFLDTIREAIAAVSSREGIKKVLAVRLYSNALFLIIDTAVSAVFGFFFWIIVARFYTEAEVGYSSAIISAISLISTVSLVGLTATIVRYIPQSEKPRPFINTILTLCGLISLLLGAIFVIGVDFWSPSIAFIKDNAIFYLTFILLTALETLSFITDSVFIAKRRAGFVFFKDLIYSIIKIPLPIILVYFFHTFGIVGSFGTATLLVVIISLFVFLPRVQKMYKPVPEISLRILRDTWKYSSSSYLASLLNAAPNLVLPLMVVNVLGAENNAYFYVAWMLSSLFFAIPGGVAGSLFAEGSHFEDRLEENTKKSLKMTYLLLIPAVIVIAVISQWLLLAFGHSYSQNARNLLLILCVSGIPLGINYIYFSLLRVRNKMVELMVLLGVIALAVLAGSYLAMPYTGIIGIGYVWTATQFAVMFYIILTGRMPLFKKTKEIPNTPA